MIIQRSQGWVAGVYILSHSIQNQLIRGSKANSLRSGCDVLAVFRGIFTGIEPDDKARLMELQPCSGLLDQ